MVRGFIFREPPSTNPEIPDTVNKTYWHAMAAIVVKKS